MIPVLGYEIDNAHNCEIVRTLGQRKRTPRYEMTQMDRPH